MQVKSLMRAFLAAVSFACLVSFAARCAAQAEKPQSETTDTQNAPSHVATTGDSCAFEQRRDIASYPNCVFQDDQGLFIAPEYVKKLTFDSYGLAVVFHDAHSGHLFLYVNRKGRVIIKDVPIVDNWAEPFSDGLVRVVVNKKIGFADRQGQIVIAPKYDGGGPFEHGYSVVCLGCRETCAASVPPESRLDVCEHHVMTGGEWLKIDKAGRVVAKVASDKDGSPLHE